MELREPEPFGVLHQHDGGVRHVDADLDDRRAHEKMYLAGGERLHDALLRVALHAPVQQPDAVGRKHLLRQMVVHRGGRLEIDLV
jgi:hypothetical protein